MGCTDGPVVLILVLVADPKVGAAPALRCIVWVGSLKEGHTPKLYYHDGTEMRPSIQKLALRGAVLTRQLDAVQKWVSANTDTTALCAPQAYKVD